MLKDLSRAEKAVFTNMCMIEIDKGQVLVQNRKKFDWSGLTFPGSQRSMGRNGAYGKRSRALWSKTISN